MLNMNLIAILRCNNNGLRPINAISLAREIADSLVGGVQTMTKEHKALFLVVIFAILSAQAFSSPEKSARNDGDCGHNHKDNKIERYMKFDSSTSFLITKYRRLRSNESRQESKQFPIYTNSKLSLTSDSISIILDLQDELVCAVDIESPYSKSVQIMLNTFFKTGRFTPKQKNDSIVIEMLLVSLASRGLLESARQRKETLDNPGFEFTIDGPTGSCTPERCYSFNYGILSIDGDKGIMRRKHHVGGGSF
jgi:hypothetical protein